MTDFERECIYEDLAHECDFTLYMRLLDVVLNAQELYMHDIAKGEQQRKDIYRRSIFIAARLLCMDSGKTVCESMKIAQKLIKVF